jgi:hypothetical protein
LDIFASISTKKRVSHRVPEVAHGAPPRVHCRSDLYLPSRTARLGFETHLQLFKHMGKAARSESRCIAPVLRENLAATKTTTKDISGAPAAFFSSSYAGLIDGDRGGGYIRRP